MENYALILCVLLWGLSTFLNRLSVEHLPPLLMQVVVAVVYAFYLPIAIRMQGIGNPIYYKWSYGSVALTAAATIASIFANLLLYTHLKGSNNTGISVMFISLHPVVTLLLSYFFLNESISNIRAVGIIAMIIGAILLGWK